MAEDIAGYDRLLRVKSLELSQMVEDVQLAWAEKKNARRIKRNFLDAIKPLYAELVMWRDKIITDKEYASDLKL